MSLRRADVRICVVALAALRAEPDDAAEQVTQVLYGEELRVEGRRDDWCRVLTSYDYPGWIRAGALSSGDPLTEARAYLGAPYEWGGMTHGGVDCSGLVHMAFRRTGVSVPRDAHQQEAAGRDVAEEELRPGDLITYGGDSADHIAFWVGDGRILHASGRDDVKAVVEEREPPSLAARRRKLIRLGRSPVVRSDPG